MVRFAGCETRASKLAATPLACSNLSMDVPPVGTGPAGMNLSRTSAPAASASPAGTPERTATGQSTADNYAPIVRELSEADLARLIQILDPPSSPQAAAQLDGLLNSAIAAASAGDVSQAVNRLAAIVVLDPRYAVAVSFERRLDPIRGQVETLLNRMVSVAKLDAEARVAEAAQRSEAIASRKLAGWDAMPETLVGIASRLLESGGHANYIRAADLAQAVIDASRWAPTNTSVSPARPAGTALPPAEEDPLATGGVLPALRQGWNGFRKAVPRRIRALWLRAPLLILLLSWLALGMVGGVVVLLVRKYQPQSWSPSLVNGGFELWATGFLALVLFGFYVRVRNVRF